MDAASIVELARSSTSTAEFQRTLLHSLMIFLGSDAGAFRVGLARPPAVAGSPSPSFAGDGAWRRHAGELGPVLSVASREQIAVDAWVLGERRVRSSRYFSEIVRPQGGNQTLFAAPAVRGRATSCLFLGRCGPQGKFRPRDLLRLRALLPAIAVAGAAVLSLDRASRPGLSSREAEIVDYLSLGFRSAEIADALGTSVHTVRNQVARLMSRLGVGTRAELIALCLPS